MADVITCATFCDDRLRGLGVARGRISRFPIDFRRRPYNTLALPCECVMDGWYVQVKGCEGDDGRSILLCGKGYHQHRPLGEQCRLVVTVKPRAPSATEKGLQALPVCCSGKTPPCTRGTLYSLPIDAFSASFAAPLAPQTFSSGLIHNLLIKEQDLRQSTSANFRLPKISRHSADPKDFCGPASARERVRSSHISVYKISAKQLATM